MDTNSKAGWDFDNPILPKVTLDEMLTYGENESLREAPYAYYSMDKPLQSWLEHDPKLTQETLVQVVDNGPTKFDISQRMATVSISSAPFGFYSIRLNSTSLLELSEENFDRIATKHGVAIIASHPKTIEMWDVFRNIMNRGMMTKDHFAVATLGNPSYYTYKTTSYAYASVPVLWWVNDLLKVLAGLYGITPSALISIAIYHSLNTQVNCCQDSISPQEKKEIAAELEFFWRSMAVRLDMIIRIGKELD
jgi:hypothetical protein